jgi:hypothetical protein
MISRTTAVQRIGEQTELVGRRKEDRLPQRGAGLLAVAIGQGKLMDEPADIAVSDVIAEIVEELGALDFNETHHAHELQ